MYFNLALLFVTIFFDACVGEAPPFFDYCEWLGEDDINGLKHGYLSGNNVRIQRKSRHL